MGTPLTVLTVVLGISLLIIVHETGHYLVARAFKMRVLCYSIGIGPAIFRYQPPGSPTVFQVCAIPLLAYVQVAGMNPHEDVDPKDPEIFPNKGLLARILTIAAGPFANYLAASLIFLVIALSGRPERGADIEPMTVSVVSEDSPASRAGLLPGDRIVEANGRPIANVTELKEVTHPRVDQPTDYVIEREGRRMTVTMTPMRGEQGVGIIGVIGEVEIKYVSLSLAEAVPYALLQPFRFTLAQIEGITHMIRTRSTKEIAGPAGMGKVMSDALERGFTLFLVRTAQISVALGFFNLLPFPALDGGRLVFLGYELITRRKANERFEAVVHTAGILFLLGVLVFVTFRDVFRFGG